MSPRERVARGQRWRHKPSGDERTVIAVVTYRERTGFDPTEMERRSGITHIAIMSLVDTRDSSDMKLVDGRPAFPGDWEMLRGVQRGG